MTGLERRLFETLRSRCAEVTRCARFVRIDDAGLTAFAESLVRRFDSDAGDTGDLDPAHDFEGDDEVRLAFALLLDAINFGSGWFPVLAKPEGLSGYRTVATACKQRFEARGSPSGAELRGTTTRSMAELIGQDDSHPEVRELMALFARAWRDFGEWLGATYADRYPSVVEAADHSAERLVHSLAAMPLYRDVARYDGLEIPFYKRAQITAADLHRTFGSAPTSSGYAYGRFDDLDRLTLFADNLVPHVLRCRGVLVYDADLLRRIEAGRHLLSGSREEIEIRAVALEAVERLVARLAALGVPTTAYALDGLLWNAGQAREIKQHPRHRTRTSFY